MESLNATEVTGKQIVQSLSETMIESSNEHDDEVINTSSVEYQYNTDISSDSGIDSDDNESHSAQVPLPLKNIHQTQSGRKTTRFILK